MREQGPRFTIHLNKSYLLQRKLPLEAAKELRRRYEDLRGGRSSRFPDPEALLIKGRTGEAAYLRDVRMRVSYEMDPQRGIVERTCTLVLEFPLSYRSREQASWAQEACAFFKSLVNARVEVTGADQEMRTVTHRPYTESEVRTGPKGKRWCIRRVSYDQHRKKYMSGSEQPAVLAKRNAWLRTRYKQLLKRRRGRADIYQQLHLELITLSKQGRFGTWTSRGGKRDAYRLGVNRIRRIVQPDRTT